jgi:hypothetical protein
MTSSTPQRPAVHTGGCQCGHVRYALYAEPSHASICHCRMCQKAFGNFFAPFATVKAVDMAWTMGEPALFQSSALVERGFCRNCGTPLSFKFTDRETISVSHGSLDDPARITPTSNIGVEAQMPWLAAVIASPGTTTEDRVPADRRALLISRQHNDGS